MNKVISKVALVLALPALIMLPGCSSIGNTPRDTRPPSTVNLWSGATETENPRQPSLGHEGGDVVLDEIGDIVGVRAIPDENSELLAVDWEDGIAGFYIIDVYAGEIRDLGGIQLEGPRPRLESYNWPWVLLQTEDEDGQHSWALIDLSSGQAQVAWEHSALVPQGLRRRPVWYNGSGWYLGPVAGPQIVDVLSGESVSGHDFEAINPVQHPWPRWAGPVNGSHWYMLPVAGGGSALLNLETNSQLFLEQDQDISWNMERDTIAWRQDNKLGLLSTDGSVKTLDLEGMIAGAPLWSSNGENLYFLGGEQDYFGTTWRDLWMHYEEDLEDGEDYYQETGSRKLLTLPGSWNRWRLLAATDEAVLASAGENSELLLYFDLMTQQTHKLNGIQAGNWIWQRGTLVAIRDQDMIRISPGFGVRSIAKEAQEYTLLGAVNQFVIYTHGDRLLIKQLVMLAIRL